MRAIPVLLLLAACAGPPPEAYVGGSAQSGEPVGLGRNAAGEACTQQAQGAGAAIFCGTYQQPSGRVARGGAAGADALAGLAASSPWRSALDSRLNCGEPAASAILGDSPALVLSCTRRVGGWPQVAMVASVGGTAYFADGILPAMPVLERSIGVLSGRVSASAAPSLPPGRADGLLASRLAAQSFGANDVGQYDQLMLAGTRANLAESYVPAEQAFRAALALQQKTLGQNDPNTAVPLMHVALQLSDQGRTADADAAFARAGQLAPRASDPTAVAPAWRITGRWRRSMRGTMRRRCRCCRPPKPATPPCCRPTCFRCRPRPPRAPSSAPAVPRRSRITRLDCWWSRGSRWR